MIFRVDCTRHVLPTSIKVAFFFMDFCFLRVARSSPSAALLVLVRVVSYRQAKSQQPLKDNGFFQVTTTVDLCIFDGNLLKSRRGLRVGGDVPTTSQLAAIVESILLINKRPVFNIGKANVHWHREESLLYTNLGASSRLFFFKSFIKISWGCQKSGCDSGTKLQDSSSQHFTLRRCWLKLN